MGWTNIASEIFYLFLKGVIIILSFYFGKSFVNQIRRKEKTKARWIEKAGIIISLAFICFMAVVFFTGTRERATVNFLITFIPTLIGTFVALYDDDLLSDDERSKRILEDKISKYKS